jgi:peptidyl-prolyl cis-trans isomerase A (cyclophilin A)
MPYPRISGLTADISSSFYQPVNTMVRLKFIALCLTLLLAGCGGNSGFAPFISAAKPEFLQYGRTATILLGGRHLRSFLVVESPGCANPVFSQRSTTELLVLNCTVNRVGDLPLSVKDPEGKLLFATTLTVPKPQVALVTSVGSMLLELDPVKAPVSVNNFLGYVRQGFYTNTLFHRVIAGFVVQGGGYTSGLVKKSGQAAPIALESNNGLSNLRGSLAMARTNDPDSATSEFYVNLVDNLALDTLNGGYAVFGTVVQGMGVVDAIAFQTTGTLNGMGDVPLSEVTITSVTQVR